MYLWDFGCIIKLSQGLHIQEKDLQSSVCGSAGWCPQSADTGVPRCLWGLVPGQAPTSTPVNSQARLYSRSSCTWMAWCSLPCTPENSTNSQQKCRVRFPSAPPGPESTGHPHSSRELKSEPREHWARVKLLRGPSEGLLHLPQSPVQRLAGLALEFASLTGTR